MHIQDCIVFHGPDLVPMRCASLRVEGDRITELDLIDPVGRIENGATVIIPGLINAHTHMGDSFLPDGATGLTLEQGFFRPNGFKYREIAKLDRASHVDYISDALSYMAATGTVAHFDFREQGPEGARRLRAASERTGVKSVILGQFDHVPFNLAELKENSADFNVDSMNELRAVLEIADGFSESTMNDLTDPAWRSVRKLTDELGKARAVHCLENGGYRSLSQERTGRGDLMQAIELYAPDLIVHLTVANDEEIQMFADSGITAVLNPRANANLGLPLPPVAKLLDAGVNLLLGTDNGLLNSPSMLAELDFIYKVTKSQYGDSLRPDPSEILKMATSNVSKTRWGKEFPGSLELGNIASFAVLDFHQSHLRRSAHLVATVLTRVTPADVLQTVRAGRVIYQRN